MAPVLSALGLLIPLLTGPQEVNAVVTANNQFALDLYRQLRSNPGNLFFSPYSITKALAMTYAGARGETADEMAKVLHFTLGQERQHRAFLETRKALNTGLGKPGVQLSLAANLWGQRGYGFRKEFLGLLHECYGAGLEEVDFAAPEAARRTINAWAGRQTHDRIPELFQQGSLDINTRLVLATAIYFKGDWAARFDKSATRVEPFWTESRSQVRVPMMNQTETFGYYEDDGLQVLRLPYAGKYLAMVVLLPRQRDGLDRLERSLTAEKLTSWLGSVNEQEVILSLPRFRLTGSFSLADTLEALGMKKAFSNSEADFSGMNGGREGLFISAVEHRAFVEVNESGTEAAAATGVAAGTLSAPPTRPHVFRADHPFLFAICDVQTGAILFLGRVSNP
jgi:serpin B